MNEYQGAMFLAAAGCFLGPVFCQGFSTGLELSTEAKSPRRPQTAPSRG